MHIFLPCKVQEYAYIQALVWIGSWPYGCQNIAYRQICDPLSIHLAVHQMIICRGLREANSWGQQIQLLIIFNNCPVYTQILTYKRLTTSLPGVFGQRDSLGLLFTWINYCFKGTLQYGVLLWISSSILEDVYLIYRFDGPVLGALYRSDFLNQ